LILLTSWTWATACEQQDLQGTWAVIVGATDEFGNHVCWEDCNLSVDFSGIIVAGTYLDCSEVTSDIIGGELTMSSRCAIKGYIETTNGTVYITTGSIVNDTLVLGRAEESNPIE
jgi:hypothetical protein